MKLKTWYFENAVVATILLFVWGATRCEPRELIGSIAVFCGFCHASIAERMREQEAARPMPSVECHTKLTWFFWGKEAAWIVYFIAHGTWAALVGCAVFAVYPFWRKFWRSIHPMARPPTSELDEACRLYIEGTINAIDLNASMVKAGIPESLIKTVMNLHDQAVTQAKETRA